MIIYELIASLVISVLCFIYLPLVAFIAFLTILIINFIKTYKIFFLREDIIKLTKELKMNNVLKQDFDFDKEYE